jgi:protein-tyrosine phosphatase
MILNLIRPGHNQPVPDPYYGGLDGFENVYRLLDTACEKIIESLNR